MDRFRGGISFLIVLTSILTGLGAAILHPYVHVLKTGEHASQHTGKTHQELVHIDSPDDCYVCTFSKKLTFDNATDIVLELTLIPDSPQILPFFCFSYGYDSVIFLRAPPLG